MAFSINGRIYHSSLGLALIILGPAGRGQLRQGLGSHDIFTIKSSASLGTLFFHKYLGNDILLDIYTNIFIKVASCFHGLLSSESLVTIIIGLVESLNT